MKYVARITTAKDGEWVGTQLLNFGKRIALSCSGSYAWELETSGMETLRTVWPNYTMYVTSALLRFEMNLNSLVWAAARDGGH